MNFQNAAIESKESHANKSTYDDLLNIWMNIFFKYSRAVLRRWNAFKWKYNVNEKILLIKQNNNEYIYNRKIHRWKKFAILHYK